MIGCFKDGNPALHETKVIIIDKDFGEWRALKIAFPNATILFCQFHISKYLFKKVVDYDVTKDKRDVASL